MQIAVVDDDENVLEFVCQALRAHGHNCTGLRSGASLLAELRHKTFDLILLDWNLIDASGVELLQTIRSTISASVGIIMLTSRSEKEDIASALFAGADDYVVKPENATVIAARVDAVLRRAASASSKDRVARFGPYAFDRLTERAQFDGEEVTLSAKEFQLALLLFENLHRALSRSYLLETLWQSVSDLPTRTLDVHVSRIRIKLKLTPENGFRIVAISGYGYRLESFGAGIGG